MHLVALCCQAMARQLQIAAESGPNTVAVQVNPQGLHNRPVQLRQVLQDQIDAIDPEGVDAILIVYGLCGTATAGIVARDVPLVIPRAHDCITLYLGSRHRYQALFDENPGTYWYIKDYTDAHPATDPLAPGGAENRYQEYVDLYGEDNAAYLMQVMGDWHAHYDRAIVIDTGQPEAETYAAAVQERAKQRGWQYQRERGNNRLLQKLVNGSWDSESFLVVPPGHRVIQTGDNLLIRDMPHE